MKETIICAAIKFKGGKIIEGHRHGNCMKTAFNKDLPLSPKKCTQGFMTSTKRFVNRKEAMIVQKKAGIPSAWTIDGHYDGDILCSEDLY